MKAVTEEYQKLPDNHDVTWIPWLRPRLRYSFKNCKKTRREYVLDKPFIAPLFGQHHNLYLRGRAFYCTGRILACFSLGNLMHDYRLKMAFDQFREIISSHNQGVRAEYWKKSHTAMEISKLWDAVTSDPLDMERISTSNIYVGIEMCLKAICTHANFRQKEVWKFPKTHSFREIWDSLPKCLRQEIVQESMNFKTDFAVYRDTVYNILMSASKQVGQPSGFFESTNGADAKFDQKLSKVCSQDTYSLFFNTGDQLFSEALSDEWLVETINRIKDLNYHRYGVDDGPTFDPLPVEIVDEVHWLGKFFYEHLFPGETRGGRKVWPLLSAD